MKKLTRLALAAAAALCAATAQADIFQFNAHLTPDQEVPPTASSAHGLATLFYDDHGTAGNWADDTWSFSMAVFELSGPAIGAHIHGAAAPGQNAPVRVDLMTAPFMAWNSGGTLLVGGDAVPFTMVPDTPMSPTNPGYPAMSFLDMLNNGLAYVNVHTPNYPAGEVRGQFMPVVSAVPEPSTYGLLLAGLGAVGWVARRRRSAKP